MQTSKGTDNAPRNIIPDLIIPIVALGFTLYYLTTIADVPWIAQASAITVSSLLLVSILAFAIRSFVRVKRRQETVNLADTFSHVASSKRLTSQRLMLLALTILFVLILPYAGFSLTTFAFIFLGIITLSSPSNWPMALIISTVCTVIGYVAFIQFFKTRFPHGPIENFLKSLL